MTVRMLQPRVAESFRNGGLNEQGNGFELGVATGKATCRCCGKRIEKGARAFTGYYDFSGNYGSWTSQKIWLHDFDCNTTPTH